MWTNEGKLERLERQRDEWEASAKATQEELDRVRYILNERDAELANARDRILDLEEQLEGWRFTADTLDIWLSNNNHTLHSFRRLLKPDSESN
tara:strand:- start:42 stop:320 length:279 start_codon:yes stop_codon:yes gene_type:complete